MAKRKVPVSSGRDQKSKLNEKGHEVPDSKPLHAALKIRRAPTQFEQMKQLIRSQEFAREFEGHESFEEADDFDVGDDFDPSSPYEEMFEGEYEYNRQQRLEAQKVETQKRRRGRQAAPRDAESVSHAPRKEISDGAAPSPKAKRGAASKGISDGESPS